MLLATSKKPNTVEVVTALAKPVVEQMGLQLWDVRFEKEGASWYLRIFIDKEGGVTIDDCENLSRAMDQILDDADPISQSYYFEVSSPGIGRDLVRPWHFQRYLGQDVQVKLIRPVKTQDGKNLREFGRADDWLRRSDGDGGVGGRVLFFLQKGRGLYPPVRRN